MAELACELRDVAATGEPIAPAPVASGQPWGTRPLPSNAATMPLPFMATTSVWPLPSTSTPSGGLSVRKDSRVPGLGHPGDGRPLWFQNPTPEWTVCARTSA